jgi:hypothetical protein
LQGFFAAQGLQGFFFAAQGLQGLHAFLAAHGLQGLQAFLAAHGLHGFFFAAHGLQGLQEAARTSGFCVAAGLTASAMTTVDADTAKTPPTTAA